MQQLCPKRGFRINMTISKKSKPGKTKDDEFKISISTEDIDKIDEAIREDDPYIYEPCPENPKLDDQFMMINGIKTLVFLS